MTAAALARAEFPVGFALDLGETDSYDNKPWDFTIKDKRERAEALVRETKPLLLIGSPPCTSFSSLFLSNKSRMKPHLFDKIVAEGLVHLAFCVKLYNIQMSENRYFIHEHPWSATSWSIPSMLKLGASPYVLTGKGNMCAQRMILRDARGSAGHVLKATGWRTNSPYILQELAVLCLSLIHI